ncbi:conserved membrane hypothetical protein [Pseudomonas sp. OF001]|jgi:hypothetical protein|uniref:DUF3429 domain-containing protein n=1 Tax=unclassified Pseudomonas TaxID=196821 RepID=UPI0010A6A3B0|nr:MULTISPECIES: DUF3429 domain-containing protein [unclassified Pseudomonas]THG85705.1 DUF3429 domain-containing protein [Pseudomonas sp. A-1]WPP46638.1 DUF3429 domain-containing protein [Pseudomonas sp. AN-1]CAD5376778.1 conserved membrane hypothetical protein [Pseudomonas sp. OF001]
MHPFTATRPPHLAWLLGLAGLIPFISGALGIWLTPVGWRPLVLTALLDYSAVILAFMGAIHWGLAMRAEEDSLNAQMQLGLSVIPPLIGWAAVSFGMPVALAIPVFILAFIGLYLADLRAVRLGLAPIWYKPLRKPLTVAVSISLLVAWGGVLLA